MAFTNCSLERGTHTQAHKHDTLDWRGLVSFGASFLKESGGPLFCFACVLKNEKKANPKQVRTDREH